jgi:hypothetical protein
MKKYYIVSRSRGMKRRKDGWIDHIVDRNCLIKHVTEGKIEKRYKRQEDEGEDVSSYWMALKRRGHWKLEEERTLWRTRFGRGCGNTGYVIIIIIIIGLPTLRMFLLQPWLHELF